MHDMIDDFKVALHCGDLEHAERLATNQLALLGESSKWLNNLGLVYLAQGRMAEALQHFDRAVAADEGFLEPLLNGAIILADLGYYNEAAVRYESAQQLQSKGTGYAQRDPAAMPLFAAKSTVETVGERLLELAHIHRQTGDRDGAMAELKRAIQHASLPAAHIELATLYLEQEECEAALDHLEQARRLDPQNPEIHIISAQCHLLKNRVKEAQDSLARAELLNDRSRTGAALRRSLRDAGG
jgi:tetratricopeptide (TPR) repeat protein